MASLQRRARLRVALSTRLHWTQFRIPRRNRPWAFTATCAACLVLQASLLASPAAHAETRCTYFVDYENFSATGAVAYTFGWGIGRNVLPEAIGPFNSARETSCGIESREFVRRAGPFRVVGAGEFDVVYYEQHVRRYAAGVDGQCVADEFIITFPKQAAEQWDQRAFQQEHPETLYTFALREFEGGKFTEKAINLLRRAADKGFKQAEHVLREYTN